MRELSFIVDGQILKKDPSCNFDDLIPGTYGYLKAKFMFSSAWDGCAKVVGFYSGSLEYTPMVIDESDTCLFPEDVLKRKSFSIQIFGQRKDFKISTNKVYINQNGGVL